MEKTHRGAVFLREAVREVQRRNRDRIKINRAQYLLHRTESGSEAEAQDRALRNTNHIFGDIPEWMGGADPALGRDDDEINVKFTGGGFYHSARPTGSDQNLIPHVRKMIFRDSLKPALAGFGRDVGVASELARAILSARTRRASDTARRRAVAQERGHLIKHRDRVVAEIDREKNLREHRCHA